METGLTKNQILSELSRSPHGKLEEYVPVGKKAVLNEPEFFAHLIAWNHIKGQIRDSKVALPIISLTEKTLHDDFISNSLAHLAVANPRELEKAYRFAKQIKIGGKMHDRLKNLIRDYLRNKETEKNWDRLALQHRKVLTTLYAIAHMKPGEHQQRVLFEKKYAPGSVFTAVANLKNMSPDEAAGTILQKRLPFLIVKGALGNKVKETPIMLALIKSMTPTELVTNTKIFTEWGMTQNPILRGAFDEALTKTAKSTANVLKTTRATEAITDETVKAKLRGVQEKQLASMQIEGNWLVLADKSGSMQNAIIVARQVASLLAKMVKGKVWLVFFNTSPQSMDVTGLALDQINELTKHIKADGGTSIGCGLQRMLDNKVEVDGIAIVSDADENTMPLFPDVYQKYSAWARKEVPVYLYLCDSHGGGTGTLGARMNAAHIDMQIFNMNSEADFYSLPNMVTTMRTNRYSLIDEVMATKLLTLSEVLKIERKEEKHADKIQTV